MMIHYVYGDRCRLLEIVSGRIITTRKFADDLRRAFLKMEQQQLQLQEEEEDIIFYYGIAEYFGSLKLKTSCQNYSGEYSFAYYRNEPYWLNPENMIVGQSISLGESLKILECSGFDFPRYQDSYLDLASYLLEILRIDISFKVEEKFLTPTVFTPTAFSGEVNLGFDRD